MEHVLVTIPVTFFDKISLEARARFFYAELNGLYNSEYKYTKSKVEIIPVFIGTNIDTAIGNNEIWTMDLEYPEPPELVPKSKTVQFEVTSHETSADDRKFHLPTVKKSKYIKVTLYNEFGIGVKRQLAIKLATNQEFVNYYNKQVNRKAQIARNVQIDYNCGHIYKQLDAPKLAQKQLKDSLRSEGVPADVLTGLKPDSIDRRLVTMREAVEHQQEIITKLDSGSQKVAMVSINKEHFGIMGNQGSVLTLNNSLAHHKFYTFNLKYAEDIVHSPLHDSMAEDVTLYIRLYEQGYLLLRSGLYGQDDTRKYEVKSDVSSAENMSYLCKGQSKVMIPFRRYYGYDEKHKDKDIKLKCEIGLEGFKSDSMFYYTADDRSVSLPKFNPARYLPILFDPICFRTLKTKKLKKTNPSSMFPSGSEYLYDTNAFFYSSWITELFSEKKFKHKDLKEAAKYPALHPYSAEFKASIASKSWDYDYNPLNSTSVPKSDLFSTVHPPEERYETEHGVTSEKYKITLNPDRIKTAKSAKAKKYNKNWDAIFFLFSLTMMATIRKANNEKVLIQNSEKEYLLKLIKTINTKSEGVIQDKVVDAETILKYVDYYSDKLLGKSTTSSPYDLDRIPGSSQRNTYVEEEHEESGDEMDVDQQSQESGEDSGEESDDFVVPDSDQEDENADYMDVDSEGSDEELSDYSVEDEEEVAPVATRLRKRLRVSSSRSSSSIIRPAGKKAKMGSSRR